LHILFLITSSDFGGAETVVAELASGLRHQQVKVTLCSLRPLGALAPKLQGQKINVFSLGMSANLKPIEFLRALLTLSTFIKNNKVDLVHANLRRAGLMASLLKIVSNPKPIVVFTQHTASNLVNSGRLYDALSWLSLCVTFRFVNRFIAVSEAVKNALREKGKVPASKISVIPNGVDDSRFFPSVSPEVRSELDVEDGELVIGSIGRFCKTKGFDVLLCAFSKLLANGSKVRCVLVGNGEEEHFLNALLRDLGIENQVCIRGYCSWPEKILRGIDIFVLPSREEGFPMVLLEAMTTGLPVIASDVGGVREIVQHNITGILVKPDDTESLLAALQRLVSAPSLRTHLGAAAQRLSKQYSNRRMVESYSKLYKDELGQLGIQ